MSEDDNQNAHQQLKSSKGRIIKKPGINEKQQQALEKLRALKDGSLKRIDQYQVQEAEEIFEQIDADEYERRQDARRNDDFIVDDDGFGYADKGGEIWEYEDHHQGSNPNNKKKKSVQQKNNLLIEQFMQPASALANKNKNLFAAQNADQTPALSAQQQKLIMDDLLGELDKHDVDELQDVNMVMHTSEPGAANIVSDIYDDSNIAFNKEEQLHLKYNFEVGKIEKGNHNQGISSSKKRSVMEISQQQRVPNPFAKNKQLATEQEKVQEDLKSLNFQSAQDSETCNQLQPETIQIQENQKSLQEDTGKLAESAIDKEWREIRQQNEQERAKLQVTQPNSHYQNYDHPIKFNDDGNLSFYWFDGHEENYGADIYLFGKVWQPELNEFVSCSLKVQGMERTIFALPKMKNNRARGSLSEEEEKTQLQSMILEFNQLRQSRFKSISGFKCKFVSRKYCFEMPISHGEHKFLKIKYPSTQPPLPANLTGNTFECLFGANQSMLELFILKRKIKGPCWLTIKNPSKVQNQANFKSTWCRQEILVSNPMDVEVTIDDLNKQSPPISVLSFSLKTTRSSHNTNEIAMVSCLVHNQINQDGPTSSTKMTCFTLVRKLDQKPWPFDFQQRLKQKTDGTVNMFQNERQLLEAFIARIHQIDPDVLLAHNLCGSVFEILIARIQFLSIPHWSRIGRLKKNQFPTRKGDQAGYSGSQWVPRMVTCGRLMVDTYVSSKELVRETNYDLGYLAQRQLKTQRHEFDEDMLPDFYLTSQRLLQLLNHTETDTFLTFRLMQHLNILPLTKQLTTIAGNMWFRSLQNARAERNEMLLLHEFRNKKYLCPDKKNMSIKEAKKNQFGDEDQFEQKAGGKGKKKKAQYGGGLVLEPKAGFYDNIILLLDFNSLYPSIIQEYNLCFTTVERKITKNFDGTDCQTYNKKSNSGLKLNKDENVVDEEEGEEEENEEDTVQLPSGNAATKDAILPNVLRTLVQKRRIVKQQMKTEKDPVKYQQLNVRQTALKLTANSMYGCLGFTSSRFHAQAIAALITRTGRETLLKTKDIAENYLNFSVIYGDTDSIMINTGTTQVKEALEMGKKLKYEVNQLYKCLEIEIDGIFKSMLLLKKKKYAALVVENYGTPDEKITTELKGLDMVRRDWCPLSKRVGNFVLKEILSGKQREDVVMSLNEFLSNIGQEVKQGTTPFSEYIITKQLTRSTTEYSDPKSLPHVQVAIRMKELGKSDADLVNNFIPYVICKVDAPLEKGKRVLMGDMAFSPDEFMDKKNNLKIDTDWYITQQVLPPITRLIEHIEGIEIDFVAQCLGVDGKKYKYTTNTGKDQDGAQELGVQNPIMKTETTQKLQDRSVASLKIVCPHCDESYEFPDIFHKQDLAKGVSSNVCPACRREIPDAYIANRTRLFIKQLQTMYYKGQYECQEPECRNHTRGLLINNKCNVVGCKGKVRAEISEEQANDTLRYLQGLFNPEKYINEQKLFNKGNPEVNIPHRENLIAILPFIDAILEKSKYNKVNLGQLFSFISNKTD